MSFPGAGYCAAGGAAGGELSIWELEPGVGSDEVRRPSEIVESKSKRADRGGGDERSEAFGGGAGVADAANPLRAAMRQSGRNGVLTAKVAVRLRVCLAQLD